MKAATLMVAGLIAFGANAEEGETSLYDRLGAWDGINQIVRDTIANHQNNPSISHYFEDVDVEQLAGHVTAFFAAGTGGPNQYEGRDMTSTHAEMGLSNDDFDSAVADVMKAVEKNGIDEAAAAEVAAILESLRPAVMGAT
jgi:hemoglobin